MKKITLLCSLFVSAYLGAQTFSDNFDSYIAGQPLAAQSGGAWTTWSNAPGGTEDGLVSNANSASAPNSMYFASTVSGGGPVDQVRNFGVLNTGSFSMSMNMFVETGKAAYFNLQKNATIGQVWALNANFNDDGTLTMDDNTNVNINTTYTQNVWFNLRIDINFNANLWEVFIDNVSQGTFSNANNQIASIDLFAVDQNTPFDAGFFIDDFEYTVTPYVLPTLNAAASLVSFSGPNLTGSNVPVSVKVRNLGVNALNSFDVTINYNGINTSQTFSGLNVASLAETTVNMTAPITLVAGANVLTATVSNVNGLGPDGDNSDDAVTLNMNPVTPAPGKVVVSEEGTGTWCGWCPRGAVFMDKMKNKYGDKWIGIAVHNGDPMTITEYDAGIGGLITGYPSALVDRTNAIDPSMMENDILQRITIAPTAMISNTATFKPISRTLTVTVSANFQAAANSNYKLACILVEDSVKGGDAGYSQTNYYSSTSQNMDLIGDDGVNWKNLANPVPYTTVIYNHVARAIQPDFNGMENSFPAVVNSGDNFSQVFTFILPATWKENRMEIVGMMIDPSGKIDNAGKIDFSEVTILNDASIFENVASLVQFYPNPTSDILNFTTNQAKIATVRILSIDGKELAKKAVNNMNGSISTLHMNDGIYTIEFTFENGLKSSKQFIKN